MGPFLGNRNKETRSKCMLIFDWFPWKIVCCWGWCHIMTPDWHHVITTAIVVHCCLDVLSLLSGRSRSAPGPALLYRDFVLFRVATQAVHLRPERKPQAGWERLIGELVRCLWNIFETYWSNILNTSRSKRMGWFQIFEDFKQKSIPEESSQIAHFSCEMYERLCSVRFLAGLNTPAYFMRSFFWNKAFHCQYIEQNSNFPHTVSPVNAGIGVPCFFAYFQKASKLNDSASFFRSSGHLEMGERWEQLFGLYTSTAKIGLQTKQVGSQYGPSFAAPKTLLARELCSITELREEKGQLNLGKNITNGQVDARFWNTSVNQNHHLLG